MQWKRTDLPVLLPKAQAEQELCILRLNKQAKEKHFQCYRKPSRKIQSADALVLWSCLRKKQKHANNTCLCCPPDAVQKLQAETAER